jgi:hypothetical protein
MAIWQDLVDGHSFAGRYASVKRFVHKLRGSPASEARVVIETAPGEEASFRRNHCEIDCTVHGPLEVTPIGPVVEHHTGPTPILPFGHTGCCPEAPEKVNYGKVSGQSSA